MNATLIVVEVLGPFVLLRRRFQLLCRLPPGTQQEQAIASENEAGNDEGNGNCQWCNHRAAGGGSTGSGVQERDIRRQIKE